MKKSKYILYITILLSMLYSCKKDDYRIDGGLAKASTPYTTYDYLVNHPYHYFDTVVSLIDHFSLKDSVNKAGTFFAPTNFSINQLMTTLKVKSLDTLYGRLTSRFLTQYMFTDTTITLDHAATTAAAYPNWADTVSGVKKTAYTYSSVTTYTYYVLQYVKINGAMDGSPGVPAGDPVDVVLNCQTSGIHTSTGTTLHILANNSTLNIR
ncbi:MAG TPA: hypothetical protein VHD83_08045 [Puia sp.]|nr:hypothetical protein [Puia sp.]